MNNIGKETQMDLSKMSEKEISQIIVQIRHVRDNRINDFIHLLKSKDFNSLQSVIDVGIDWSDQRVWSCMAVNAPFGMDFVKIFQGVAQSELGETLIEYKQEKSFSEMHKIFDRKNATSLKLKDMLKDVITNRICRNMPGSVGVSNDWIDILGEYLTINESTQKYIALSANKTNIDASFTKFIEIITKDKKMVNYFLQNTNANNIKFIKDNFSQYDDLFNNGLLQNYLDRGSMEQVDYLISLGLKWEKSNIKAMISKAFSNKQEEFNACREFILNNVDDITFGNQVILRTILRTQAPEKINILNKVLDRYDLEINSNEEMIALFKAALQKRDPGECVDFVNKRIEYLMFQEKIDKKSSNNSKMKI